MGGSEEVARRLVASVSRNLGQSATLATLARDVFVRNGGEESPTDWEKRQVSEHLDILRRAYIVEEVPGWAPASRSPERVRIKPRRYLADPSIAAATLGMSGPSLLQDWRTFGLVFENLCMRDLATYAQALPHPAPEPLRYYRDDAGLEVDAVVEQADGRWAALEVKVGMDKVDGAARNLLRLAAKVGGRAGARVPLHPSSPSSSAWGRPRSAGRTGCAWFRSGCWARSRPSLRRPRLMPPRSVFLRAAATTPA